jgi:hypothetical protein
MLLVSLHYITAVLGDRLAEARRRLYTSSRPRSSQSGGMRTLDAVADATTGMILTSLVLSGRSLP